VVLKTPSVERREDSAYLDGFVLEEWVARRVDSPHVIKAWPDDRRRAHLYVALEYIDGQTLAQWMADNPEPSLASVRAIVEQLAQGLQALHRREMLHQDLRPENVMIDGQGTVKLIDLATVHVAGLDEMHGYAAADLVPGALQYAAPNTCSARAAARSPTCSRWPSSPTGCSAGSCPTGWTSPGRAPADVRRLRYIPLRHHRPDLPAWLDAVLGKALQADPARRQAVISEFVHDLRAPGQQFRSQRPPPLIERNPVLFWQASTLVLALVALALAFRQA
jgi:serine/threonine protein kinase